ncbi:hypothetical protein BKA67DRAFT_689797 [Truncatella angustata]|uniref:Methyltransferase domain-containing protein n=1 Tax=Truncatella angustata TaxID=152316 RepID=A0A9P9A3B6_9PEZI|nr:uncharacterized protein BKA67DRAFT_689797 [Truncatella angustata]KAH6658760.1 hypothetical protein BKA67DRAFT_689797 [Truncatella angustata]
MATDAEKWKQLPQDHLARSTKVPWYLPSFEHKLKTPFRKLLEEWSNISPDNVVPHVYRIREEAWQVFPWPCIGEFWFIEQGLRRHPDYSQILNRIISAPNSRFLDLGTCLGQDVRTLAHNGASLSSLYGADVLPGFRDAGYSLFNDSDRLDTSHFVTGDIFSDVDDLAKTRGTWDIIHVAMFLHVFSLPDQEAASRNTLKLLKPTPGSTVIGTQTGSLDSGDFVLKPPLCEPGEHRVIYRQSKDTLKNLFEMAAKTIGLSVNVWTEYDENEARKRAEGRKEKGEEWEKKGRFFAGNKERRIFFRVEII